MYNDKISKIDSNLTDSKYRNIRDNIFGMNAILNSTTKENEEAPDVQIYDIEKCVDTLWLHEVINCLYKSGLTNDKLPLLFLKTTMHKLQLKLMENSQEE